MKILKGLARNPFFWFAAFLLLAELASYSMLPYRNHPTAAQVPRNPTKHRGWPEYLDVTGDSRKLVVLISNSQAMGAELENSSEIYFALARGRIQNDSVAMENWSSGGVRTTEVELLALEAMERNADLVVMALAINNFDERQKLNLDFPFSDIPLFAGHPAIWSNMPGCLFMENTKLEDILSRIVTFHSSFARSRMVVSDAVASRTPMKMHRWALGREVRPGNRLDALKDPDVSIYYPDRDLVEEELRSRREARSKRKRHLDRNQSLRRLETFQRFYAPLRAKLKKTRTKLVWIWTPQKPGMYTHAGYASEREFLDTATETIRNSGVNCHDLIDFVEQKYFVTPGHFNRRGHEIFAQKVVEIVRDEL